MSKTTKTVVAEATAPVIEKLTGEPQGKRTTFDVISGNRPTLQNIPVSECEIDPRNPRTPERFLQNVNRLIGLLIRNGVIPNHPIVVLRIGPNRYLVIIGNTRTKALQVIAKDKPDDFARICPDGTIGAFVYENLSDEDRVILATDHGADENRQGLNDEEMFYAVKNLYAVGLSQAAIAQRLGQLVKSGRKAGEPNRSFIQPRANLCRLPKFVQDEFVKLWRGDESRNAYLAVSDIAKLYLAYNLDNPDGSRIHPEGGENYKAAWSKATQADTTPTPPGSVTMNKEDLTVAEAQRKSNGYDSNVLKFVILALTGQSGRTDLTLSTVDKLLVSLEALHPDMFAPFNASPAKAPEVDPKAVNPEPVKPGTVDKSPEPVASGKAKAKA